MHPMQFIRKPIWAIAQLYGELKESIDTPRAVNTIAYHPKTLLSTMLQLYATFKIWSTINLPK